METKAGGAGQVRPAFILFLGVAYRERKEKMKVVITGPAGKMGRAMVRCAFEHPDIELTGAVGPVGRDYIGRDIGWVCGLGEETGLAVADDLETVISGCDTVLDCTNPETAMAALEVCIKHRKAFVTGTTGFSDGEVQRIRDAGSDIPVIRAYNTSRLFNLLFAVVRDVASRIGARADIDIIDVHDRKKPDAPSGTAKEIAGIIAEELDCDETAFTYGRKGMALRRENSIAFTSIRSGGYPGSVKAVFGLDDERMELSAHVYNSDTYARGMIDAGMYLTGKGPGVYDLNGVFDL